MDNALGNNDYLLDKVSGKAADIIQGLTTQFDNTMLAMLTSSKTTAELAGISINNIGDLADKAMNAYIEFWNRNAEVWTVAGHDVT